jgi:hypothetical protein
MESKQQNIYPTDYYLSQPISQNDMRMYIMGIRSLEFCGPALPNFKCLFYAPLAVNGNCRVCFHYPKDHKKYYIYSIYASKIQRCYLKFKVKKFIKKNFLKFTNHHSIFPPQVLIFKFKKKYYRKWNNYYLDSFLKSIN